MNEIIGLPAVRIENTDVSVRPQQVRSFASEVHRLGDRAKIALAAAWREVKQEEYWKGYGYSSFDQYIMEEFSYGRSTSEALIDIYETYIDKLGFDPQEICSVPWYGLRAIKPFITESNCREFVNKMKEMSQKEIKAWVKTMQGLHPSETAKAGNHRFTFNFEEDQAEVIRQALDTAKSVSGSEIPAENLEVICAEYMVNNLDELDDIQTLEKWVKKLEKMFGVRITWEK